MKKILKNIIICICIVYFILNVGYSIMFKGYYNEVMIGYNENYVFANSNQEYKYMEFIKQYVGGQLNILNSNINIVIISIILGVMLGLLISQKENTIVKYLVYFILGYLLYCVLWTFMTILVNKSVSDVISNNFIEIYYNTLPKMLYSYIMFYAAGLIGVIFRNKINVKVLNETLKNPDNRENAEKVLKIVKRTIIILIILIVIIFIGNTIRKTFILIEYSKKINEISNCNNYYVKEESRYNYMEGNIRENYYKDDILVHKDKRNDNIFYSNENTKENLSYLLNMKKVVKLDDDVYRNFYKIRNNFFGETSVRKWGNLLLAFSVDIYSEECNGKDCYVIEQHGDKLYLDKDTFLEVRKVEISDEEALKRGEDFLESIYDYTYEFGNVIDEDVAKPDISEFSLQD